MTKEEFIIKARTIHGNKYDYSKVEYKGVDTKVYIICPVHGEFYQTPYVHLKGHGCRQCGFDNSKQKQKNNIDDFIAKARKIHGDKYDYSKVEYVNANTKVLIICPKHGEFLCSPSNHLKGRGCPKCIGRFKTTDEFIKQARAIHGDKYDYSKTEYVNCKTEVTIICPKHGEFKTKPSTHLNGHGCPLCSGGRQYSLEEFLRKSKIIHGDKYDYSKVIYTKSNKKVCIICPKHGEFWQTPVDHLQGKGCFKCAIDKHAENDKFTKEEFINKARMIHGDKYDYSKVEYINSITPICIICPKHGEFWQIPNNHLRGKGCSICQQKKDLIYNGNYYPEIAFEKKIFTTKELFKSDTIEWIKNPDNFYHIGVDVIFDGEYVHCLINGELNTAYPSVGCRKQIPSFVKFGTVECDFTLMESNDGTLIGSPRFINGNFNCSGIGLNSFIGMPSYINGVFDISHNELTDKAWEYAKENIDGEFGVHNIFDNKFIKYQKELY